MSSQFDSGISFNEVTVKANPRDRNWIYSPDIRQRSSKERRAAGQYRRRRLRIWPKPRSLIEITLEVIVKNLPSTDEETIASLPLPCLWRIYHECATNGMISFHAWKMFSKLLLADKDHNLNSDTTDRLYSFCATISDPSSELSCFTGPLVCSGGTLDFLVSLTIKGVDTFRTDELLVLARLENLFALTLDYSRALDDPGVTDNLVKGWSETDNAFPLLQSLHLSGPEITHQSLKYIFGFHSLSVYGLWNPNKTLRAEINRNAKALAEQHGWAVVSQFNSYDGSSPSTDTQLPAGTPKTPTADITIQQYRSKFTDIKNEMIFRRGHTTNPSTSSSQLPEKQTSLPGGGEPGRAHIQPRKRQKLQAILSSFEPGAGSSPRPEIQRPLPSVGEPGPTNIPLPERQESQRIFSSRESRGYPNRVAEKRRHYSKSISKMFR